MGRSCADHFLTFPPEVLRPLRLAELTAEYFTYLGEGVLRRRGADFWSFHLDALAAIGESFSGLRKLKYTTLALLDLGLNPKQTIQRLRGL